MEDLNSTPNSGQQQKQRTGKRKRSDIDLNKVPKRQSRPKVKKHRPKIFDPHKPKKVFKKKVVKVEVPKSKKTSNLDPKTPNKPPKERRKKKNVAKSQNSSELGLDCLQTTPLDSAASNPKKLDLGLKTQLLARRFSNGACRRSLNFNLENLIKYEREENVAGAVVGNGEELKYSSVFDMLIVTLGSTSEDFGSSSGMRKFIGEYQGQIVCSNTLLDFPKEWKKKRTTRKRRSFLIDLAKTIQLYNGQKIPTRKRSNRSRSLVILKESRQNLICNVNQQSKQNVTSNVNEESKPNSVGPTKNKSNNMLTSRRRRYVKRESEKVYDDIDLLAQKLESLQISDDSIQKNRVRTLVPYVGKIKVAKKYVPKVDLDEESIQVWNRLMGNNTYESIQLWNRLLGNNTDDTRKEHDEEKQEWWEKEREMFRRRVDTLIARMHLVQGNRKFSPWKGSIVDSIVGVFLTQNVSDHLSSSAFMSLISRFPAPPYANQNHFCGEIGFGQQYEKDKESNGRHGMMEERLLERQYHTREIEKTISQEIWSGGPSASSEESSMSIVESSTSINYNEGQKIKLESATNSAKKKTKIKEKKEINWDEIRRIYSRNRPRSLDSMDSVDWNAVRQATLKEIADVIALRGMNNVLAGRIKDFLDSVVKYNIDLEWLRDVPPDLVKEYLSGIEGIGLKSVECLRLLTFRHHAFPVDTNVGRIVVRLGWVPLQPLPENLGIDLLDQYPMLDSIQKYLWPRLCMLDGEKLYELHYQLITFGKVFCTKKQPNCNACPMKAECRHFASAYARAKLGLTAPEENGFTTANNPGAVGEEEDYGHHQASFPLISLVNNDISNDQSKSCDPVVEFPLSTGQECQSCEPIVEFPHSPVRESGQRSLDIDIEDLCKDSDDEIPTIRLDTEGLRATMLELFEKSDISKALVPITPEASIPAQKLKIVSRLRTVHNVFELNDDHPLLQEFDKRDPHDKCPYLLAIGVSGDSSDVVREKNKDEVNGTILIPGRTAMRGNFPLNGTYFQTNEVFVDYESSKCPIRILRKELSHLKRRALYCGTSVTSILRGMNISEIQYCFWKGFVCVRAFDKRNRAPKPLPERFRGPGGPAKNFKEKFEYDE